MLRLRHKYSISVPLRAKSRTPAALFLNISRSMDRKQRPISISKRDKRLVVTTSIANEDGLKDYATRAWYNTMYYTEVLAVGNIPQSCIIMAIELSDVRGRLRQRSDLACHERLSRLQWRLVRVSSSATAWDCMGLLGTDRDYMAWDYMRLHEAGLSCLHSPIRSDRSHTIIVDDISFLQPFYLICSQSSRCEIRSKAP